MFYAKAIKMLRQDEGLRLKPYKCSAGKLTIGIGRNLEAKGISEDIAIQMATEDLSDAIIDCIAIFGSVWNEIDETRQLALVNMSFNLGRQRLEGFKKLIAAVKAKDWTRAASEALDSKWSKQVGARSFRVAKMLKTGSNPYG